MNLPKPSLLAATFLGGALFLTGCVTPPDTDPVNAITPRTAARFAPYAMMAANSYHNKSRPRFPVELLGWRQVDLEDQPETEATYSNDLGLAFDIYKHDGDNTYACVFRGTDSKFDYPIANLAVPLSVQYKSANKRFGMFLAAHPGLLKAGRIVVVGHSLGGGLALSASVHEGVPAIVFDSSPRVFDGLGDHQKPALREAVYERGEVLELLRSYSTKYPEVVRNRDTYRCEFDFGKVSKHSIQKLAEELAKFGAPQDPRLRGVLAAMPR